MVGIHIIKGKPAPGANLMASAVKSNRRYDYRVVEHNAEVCTLAFFENGEKVGESTFTAEDAAKAGTQNMSKFPRNMLFARAISNGVRWFCPDVFGGVTAYTPEELGAPVDGEGEVIDVTPTPINDMGPDWNAAPGQNESDALAEAESDATFRGLSDTSDGINSPRALLEAVKEPTGNYYKHTVHMLNALKKVEGDEYSWPGHDNVKGYMAAYQLLLDHAEASKA